jgi:hypothetical protein
MRNAVIGGALGAGALLAGSKALQEQEDPGSIFLAGLGGGAGGYAGLLGAKSLAGKYSPMLGEAIKKGTAKTSRAMRRYAGPTDAYAAAVEEGRQLSPEEVKKLLRPKANQVRNLADSLEDTVLQKAGFDNPNQAGLARALGAGTAVATVPTAALTAGLGGVAAGAIPGAFGIPGFVDPESYGSSNSPGARYKQTTMNYI